MGVTSLKSVVCCLAVRLGRFEERARLLDEDSACSQHVGRRPSEGQGSRLPEWKAGSSEL